MSSGKYASSLPMPEVIAGPQADRDYRRFLQTLSRLLRLDYRFKARYQSQWRVRQNDRRYGLSKILVWSVYTRVPALVYYETVS